MHAVRVPHLALPFRITPGGSAAVVEQDTLDDVAQCVEVLLSTVRGERIELPEYGIPELPFTTGIDHAVIRAEIERWEPRAAVALASGPTELDVLVHEFIVRTATRREG